MKTPKTMIEAIAMFADEQKAHEYFVSMRWPNGVCCPRCGCVEVSFVSTRRIWKCKGCRKQFSAKVGTIFEDSPLSLGKWMTAIWFIVNAKNGISSCEVSRSLGIKQDSAWHMMHRIRVAMEEGSFEKSEKMSGRIEADETWIGGLEKNRHKDAKKNLGRGGVGKEIVFGMRERGGRVRTVHVPDTAGDTLQGEIAETVKQGSTLYTDTWAGYKGLSEEYEHFTVNHNFGQYRKGEACTNGMENYWTILKRAYKGTYVQLSPQHLSRYLAEEDFRFNSREQKDGERFESLVKRVGGKRLAYRKLTESHLQTLERA